MKTVLPSVWSVPDRFNERLGQTAGRQRAMVHEGHLLLILHRVPEPGLAEREHVFFWRNERGDWQTSGRGPGLLALKALLDEYDERVAGLGAELNSADEADDVEGFFSVLRAIQPILRAAHNLRGVLQAAREAVSDKAVITLRDRALEIERDTELLLAEAKHALDYAIARQAQLQVGVSNELARSGARLNLLVSIFLPLTALGAVFGMNLTSGLEFTAAPYLFWGVAALGVVTGFLLRGRIGGVPPG